MAVPYIGSKISLVSNADIRYEGILYTINTQESTIAVKSVRCCGTEGRKVPEILPTSEIYDFIIFRGQDIKDLTVLENANPALSAQLNDPAIMSVNERPAPGAASGKGVSSATKGSASGASAVAAGSYGGKAFGGGSSGAYGKAQHQQHSSYDYGKGQSSWGGPTSWGGGGGGGWYQDSGYGGKGGGWGGSYGGYGGGGGKGKDTGYGGKGGGKSGGDYGGKAGGKSGDKGGKSKGGKGDSGGKGKSGTKGKGGGWDKGAGRRVGDNGAPVGELAPETNEAVKNEYATDFDYTDANGKFDKVGGTEGEEGVEQPNSDDRLKPLGGYDKGRSFFDDISCEATERAGDVERRPKIDRDKARENDRETFGDTRRPPRPVGGRGKGGGRKGR